MEEAQALELHDYGQQMQSEGRHAEAAAAFAQSAEYFAMAEGEQSPDLANVLLDETESLLALCRYDEAERCARRAKEIVAGIADLLDAETRAVLLPRASGQWGRTLRELGRYEEAAEPLQGAIRECSEEMLPNYLNDYGILCKYWGKFDEGEQTYLRALAMLEARFGKDAPETATLYHNLGGIAHTAGDFAKGEPLARKAYEIRRAALGEEHEATVADAVAWGGLLDGLGRHEESLPIYRRALAYYEERLGPEHFEVAATLNNLGFAEAARGNHGLAEKALRRCLEIKLKLFGAEHPEVALTQRNLAVLAIRRREAESAE